ncbi:MAG: HlyC/CorC family transporter [Chitinophagaceae bacterium]|nr:HlyC/CorC family transporter [Chitinophagaceae bacterium]
MKEILIILGLILFNGLFAMAEIALVSARKARLEGQANKGDIIAKRALNLANKPDTFISTIQLIITLISLLTGIFSGEKIQEDLIKWLQQFPAVSPYSHGLATTIVVVSVTYVALVLGELVPKRIGLSNPESIAKKVSIPLTVIITITHPFVKLLNISTNFITGIFRIRRNDNQVTEEEIKAIISEGTEQGTIEEAEQEIIERVFHLSDRNITSLMTHRSDIVWLDISKTIGDVKKEMTEVIHSVYPVCEGNIDSIKGVVSIKNLFTNKDEMLIGQIIEQPMYVPENNTAYQVLEQFKETKIHHCFIVDEYGSVEGLITLNDILEAIVGDIPQHDEIDYEITERTDGSFLIDAQIPFYDFLRRFEKTEWMNDDEYDFDTLAGFILHKLKKIPSTGDTLEWRGFKLEIVDMDNHRIDKLLVTLTEKNRIDE